MSLYVNTLVTLYAIQKVIKQDYKNNKQLMNKLYDINKHRNIKAVLYLYLLSFTTYCLWLKYLCNIRRHVKLVLMLAHAMQFSVCITRLKYFYDSAYQLLALNPTD